MKIIQVSTVDIKGGAAKAAYRLHRGLIEIGQESLLLTRYKSSSQGSVISVSSLNTSEDLAKIQEYYLNKNRTQVSNTLFSLAYPGLDFSQLTQVLSADLINLHWIAHLQSPTTLKKLLDLNKPIVWTLHDMWAFTGGCHYSSGCQSYQKSCAVCPQLQSDSSNLPSAILKDKLELLNNPNLVIVTPSKWLANCAKKSQLFKDSRIEIIPYGLETNIFYPLSKVEAKKLLNINPDTITLLIGADEGNEKRKGFTPLLQALQLCQHSFQDLAKDDKIQLLSFGNPNEQLQKLDIPLLSFGQIQDDSKLAQIYSAADIFLLPSLEDNFPNTMLEAMSCGTPVVAFQVGGIPDLVEDRITGRIIPELDIDQMAVAILELVFNRDLSQQLGQNSRRKIESNYSLKVQAEAYLELYKDLLKGKCSDDLTSETIDKVLVPLELTLGSNFKEIFAQVAWQANKKNAEELEGFLLSTQNQLTDLKQVYTELKQSKESLEMGFNNLQVQLEETQRELRESKETVYAMTTSKFWKIRELWFKLKGLVN